MEEFVSSKRIYGGRILSLRVDEVRLENGRLASREIVEHLGAAAVLPVFEDGDVMLVRQYRYPVGESLLEIPAGTLRTDEEPSLCASRELEEETGYRSEALTKIGECFVAPGYSTERIHIYLAKQLKKTQNNLDEDESITVVRVKFSEAWKMVQAGEIRDAKSIVGLQAAVQLLSGSD